MKQPDKCRQASYHGQMFGQLSEKMTRICCAKSRFVNDIALAGLSKEGQTGFKIQLGLVEMLGEVPRYSDQDRKEPEIASQRDRALLPR